MRAGLAVGVVGSGVVGVHGSKLPAPVSYDRTDRRQQRLDCGLSGVGIHADRRGQFVDPGDRRRDGRRLLTATPHHDENDGHHGREQHESPRDGKHLLLLHVHSVPVRCGRMPLLTPAAAEVVVWRA